MTSNNTIVFGPTGSVGSVVARTAQHNGAKVFLAMRDSQKPIPGLTPKLEQEGGFERVQADLEDPESVHAAVEKTGAKRAFIYVAFTSADQMKSTIMALKSGGIEFVVFLSSDGIRRALRHQSQESPILWTHAQVEINLEEIFGGDGYAAVRPACFASNNLWWAKEISEGNEVQIPYPDVKFDWITNTDIGTVCGNLLTGELKGFETVRQKVIRLNGPELHTQRHAVGLVAKAISKDIQIKAIEGEEAVQRFIQFHGFPEPIARNIVSNFSKTQEGEDNSEFYAPDLYKEASNNVRKYTGREPTTLQEWVNANKNKFIL
jgi:uncharacterized protein YbjT (DUF2867 family)